MRTLRQMVVASFVVGLCAGPVFAASKSKKKPAAAAAKEPEKRPAMKDATDLKLELPHMSWKLGSGDRMLDATDISVGGNGSKAAEKKSDKPAAPKAKAKAKSEPKSVKKP